MIKKVFHFIHIQMKKKKFLINLKIENENLVFIYKEEIDFKGKEFICKINFEEIKKINIFSTEENLEQIFKFLKDIINNNIEMNKFPTIQEQTNKLLLIIPLIFGDLKELVFNLDEKEKNLREIIDELIIFVKEKDKNINEILSIIDLIQKKIDDYENEIKKLVNRVNEIELKMGEKKNYNEKIKALNISEIILISKFPEINLNDEKYEIKNEYYDNLKLKCIGQILKENKKYNGKVIEFYENENIKFEGDYKNGKRDGKGIVYYKSGKILYEGEFKLDKWEGKGIKYYENEMKLYEGYYKNDCPDGKGILYYNNGNKKYEGEYKDGNNEGKGIEYYENGNKKYEGEFKKNKKDGNGILYDDDGNEIFEGYFEDDNIKLKN